MSILPQLERDLVDAARKRLPVATEPARRRSRGAPARRPSLAGVVAVLSVAVTLAIAGLAVGLLSNHRAASNRSQAAQVRAGENPVGQQLYGKQRGGVLTAYSSDGFDHLDPGESYDLASEYAVDYATQRPLFSYLPNDPSELSPDLATEVPTTVNGGITDGGRTVTVHIRQGVYFSPPVNREVTSADVAYAIERGANPNVANPYFAQYFGSGATAPLLGAQSPTYKGGPIPGIQTPNKFTIVFHTTKPSGSLLVGALSLPLSAPVPQSFVGPLDEHRPTAYGRRYLVATGPYMIKANSAGMIAGIGYQPARPPIVPAIGHLTLVRNPNWKANTDYRPAYLDQIDIAFGGDPTVIGQRVLKGSGSIQLDPPAASIAKLAYDSYPSQITFTPGAGDQYVALDNHRGPFTNVNLRRALWAALDREAIARQLGGPPFAQPMTHFLYPGVDGFKQAGGYPGPRVDYNTDLSGNMALAARYVRRAGYPSGKYTGGATIQIVGSDKGAGPTISEIVANTLTGLGFHVRLSLVNPGVMYTRYCEVPAQEVDVCPTVGWVRDFADPMTVLYRPFYGPAITPTSNANFGQVDDPQINAAMTKAAFAVDSAARAKAWVGVDRLLVDKAVAVPETFDSQPNIKSSDVAGVSQLWNAGAWDLDFTSLK